MNLIFAALKSGLASVLPGPSILWRIGAYALLVVALIGFGYVKGNQHGTAKLTAYQGAEAAAAVKLVVKQGAATERVVTQYVKVAGATKTVTETIEKEVVRYETAKLDACPLTVGFVSLHDSAAANSIPDPARAIDGAASAVTANQALGTVTRNYSLFHETADRLRALQSWVKEQQKVAK